MIANAKVLTINLECLNLQTWTSCKIAVAANITEANAAETYWPVRRISENVKGNRCSRL